MDISKFTNFLTQGAFLQTGPEQFILLTGPFKQIPLSELKTTPMQTLLYKPLFWDFLEEKLYSNAFFAPQEVTEISRLMFLELCQALGSKQAANPVQWLTPDQDNFKLQFDWIQTRIAQKKLRKALPLTVQYGHGFLPQNKPTLLQNILTKKIPGYAYGVWSAEDGLLGHTPELLADWDQKRSRLNTMAFAGTWPKSATAGAIDFEDSKTHDEHQIVVEDIRQQLADFKNLEQKPTEIVELPHLYHLKTEFAYQVDDLEGYLRALRQLHPTAALGLYPRDKSLFSAFYNLPLQSQRANFGAPFGVITPNWARAVVAIRNIVWQKANVSIFSGCGITEDSQFAAEWTELEAKRESVKKLLGLN